MKKVFWGAVMLAFGLTAQNARAASFFIDFCPDVDNPADTCPAGVTEASLTFVEILAGTDPNDYDVYLKIVGDATSPLWIDTVQFKIDSAQTPSDYELKPTLSSAPIDGSPWTIYFDQIDGNPTDCTADTGNGQGVCAQSTGNGAITNGTNVWKFLVDLDDDPLDGDGAVAALAAGSKVNLRAHFLTLGGQGGTEIKNGGILSPGGGALATTGGTATTSGGVTTSGTVPEPALLSLLGLGLLGAAARLRNKA